MTALASRFADELTALLAAATAPAPERAVAAGVVAPERSEHVEDVYPVTALQEGLLFHSLYGPGSYVVQPCLRIDGELDPDRLRAAWAAVLDRHPALRTAFPRRASGTPLQVVHRAVRPEWTIEDWRGDAGAEARLAELLAADRERGIDVAEAPLMRFHLVRVEDDVHWLVWTHHHVLLDGWSVPVVIDEVLTTYDGATVPGEHRPYRDYVRWLREQDLGAADAYWRVRLAGVEAPTPLGVPTPASGNGHRTLSRRLDVADSAALDRFARGHQLTASTLVHAAWALVLARLSGEDDVVFGVTVSGRSAPLAGIGEMVGLFINTIPARIRIDPARPLAEWLTELQLAQAERQAYEYTPLDRIQRGTGLPGGTDLFHSLVVVTNYPDTDSGTTLTVTPVDTVEATNYPLTIGVTPGGSEGATVTLTHDRSRIGDEDAALLADHFTTVLTRIATADPRQPVTRVGAARPPAPATRPGPNTGLLHELVAVWAERTPDATAVEFGDDTLTYAELVTRAGTVAGRLRHLGIGPESRVGICLDRSADLVVAILGVLTAGAAYVPMDPNYPPDRLAFLAADADLAAVLTTTGLPSVVDGVPVVHLDRSAASAVDVAPAPVSPDNLAYVIYTSGSTGTPKGVGVSHRTVVPIIEASVRAFGLRPGRRVLQHASMSFDNSVWEVFMALTSGAVLCLGPADAMTSGDALATLIGRHDIDFAVLTPSVAGLLDPADVPSLRTLLVGGEAMPASLAERWSGACELYNTYGPTEASIHATLARIQPDTTEPTPPIGSPNTGVEAHVLDRWGAEAPPGVVGELYLGGVGISRGYLGRPGLTAARFVPDELSGTPGARLYRTGDRVRRRASGELEFVGRADGQVKVRGFRIELGEVEAAVRDCPRIGDAVVTTVAEDGIGNRLVAYVVPEDGTPPELPAVRSFLAARLPAFMVPSVFVPLAAIPVGPTGKVDLAALPEIGRERLEAGPYRAPEGAEEQALAELWSEVLRVDRIAADDDFFALGGDSILAARAIARTRHRFGVDLGVRALFEHPTVAAMAARLATARPAAAGLEPDTVADGPAPLSFAQERLWFLEKWEPDRPLLNLTLGYRLTGPLDLPVFAAALDTVVARHEGLRTRFVEVDDRPVAVVGESVVELVSRSLDAADADAAIRALATTESGHRFAIDTGPLVRFVVVALPDRDEHALILVAHHIVLDEASTVNLMAEVGEAYTAVVERRPATLPELSTRYRDVVGRERRLLTDDRRAELLSFWRPVFTATAATAFPVDRPRRPAHAGRTVACELPADASARVREFARAGRATTFMVVTAAVHSLLARATGERAAMTGAVLSQRVDLAHEPLIGPMLNLLPVRTDLVGTPTFPDVVAKVREAVLATHAHQDAPFEWLVTETDPPRRADRHPVVQVVVQTQGPDEASPDLAGVTARPLDFDTTMSKFDLTITVADPAGEPLTLVVEYDTELFAEQDVRDIVDRVRRLVGSAAESPGTPVAELRVVGPDEHAWGAIRAGRGRGATIPALVAASVAEHGDAVAVEWAGGSLTYRELDRAADALAGRLRAHGVGPETSVACCLVRSADLVVGLLAVLRAGGVCVPVDPRYPEDRVLHMIEDCGAPVVLAHEPTMGVASGWGLPIVAADAPVTAATAPPEVTVRPDNGAYVIYTSGSTGRPKGAVLTHAALCNRLAWGQHALPLDPTDRVLHKASTSFDFAIWECFGPLVAGARVVLCPAGIEGDPAALVDVLRRDRITVTHFVPSLLQLVADVPELADCELRHVYGGAEALPAATARAFLARSSARLHNVYGATEVAIDATHWDCDPDAQRVSIGGPIDGCGLYVLDAALHPVPVGGAGEIHVAGAGLARGYLGRPGLTAERFVPDPHGEPGGRMYRTGDLATRHRDGTVEYLGRADQQTKVRGFRVEPAEIEAVVGRHPAVRQCAVVAVGEGADRRLVGHVVPVDAAEPVTGAELTRFAREALPAHLVPSGWAFTDHLPRTPSGKLDRRTLLDRPQWTDEHRGDPGAHPELRALWAEVLGMTEVGADDDFFELGGHSLLAVKLIARVRERFGRVVALRELFDAPTVSGLAVVIERAATGAPPGGDRPRLTSRARPSGEPRHEPTERRDTPCT